MAIREPESCICPTCKTVMKLSRVPALRALDAIEFYLRCDACDYTSGQLTGIASGEFACDIHQEPDYQLKPSGLIAWCDREVAILVGAPASKSVHRPVGACRLPLIGNLRSGAAGAAINLDRPVPTPSLPDSAALPVVATFLVISTVAASLAGYFASSPSVVSSVSAPTLTPIETERVTQSSWWGAEEPPIRLKTVTTGSATAPKAPTRPFEKMMHPKRDSTDTEMVVDPGDGTSTDSKSAKDQSSPFNPPAFHHNVDPTFDAEDTQFSNERRPEFSAVSEGATARPLSTRAESRGVVTGVTTDRAGFVFGESDVRYLSVAELEKLSPEQLRIARHEILARKGRFFKDPTLSVHFRKFSWYQPSVWRVRLNPIEQANVSLILSIETSYNSKRPEIALQKQN